jgi:hypothetical protein
MVVCLFVLILSVVVSLTSAYPFDIVNFPYIVERRKVKRFLNL